MNAFAASAPTSSDDSTVSSRHGRGWAIAFVACVLAQQAFIFIAYRHELRGFLDLNSDWLTWQYLLPSAFRDRFWFALLTLQQTPPLPNLLMGIADIAFDNPTTRNYFCLALQVAITVVSGILMLGILRWFTGRSFLSFLVVLTWALSNDVLTMEFNSHGQTFYENLAMLLLLAITSIYLRWHESPGFGTTCLLGLGVSLLALTRASFSFFFFVPLIALVVRRPRHLYRHVMLYLACALSLHGAWCAKNALLYGHPGLATSSWKGLNLAVGLQRAGYGDGFAEFILDHPDRYPEWFVTMIRKEGIVLWNPPQILLQYVSPEIRQQDDYYIAALHGTNRPENLPSILALSELYALAFRGFAVEQPALVISKAWSAYWLMWEPIHTYSIPAMGFFKTSSTSEIPFAPPKLGFRTAIERDVTLYLDSRWNRLLLAQGKWPALSLQAATQVTIPFVPEFVGFLNLIVFHVCLLLLPLLRLFWPAGRRIVDPLLFMTACAAYLAAVSSIAEYSENMRFRVAVEPLIWIVCSVVLALGFALLLQWLRRWRSAPTASLEVP